MKYTDIPLELRRRMFYYKSILSKETLAMIAKENRNTIDYWESRKTKKALVKSFDRIARQVIINHTNPILMWTLIINKKLNVFLKIMKLSIEDLEEYYLEVIEKTEKLEYFEDKEIHETIARIYLPLYILDLETH